LGITFYGERGLVDSIILDMQSNKRSNSRKQKDFLRAIKFTHNASKSWINQIKKFDYIVEPSFSQFGNPDLIMIAEEGNGKRHVIFIEAKVCDYNDASQKLGSNLLPKSYKNIASKLNIQLAFKYRFAKAYDLFRKRKNSIIEEDASDATQYNDSQRVLKKASVIELCKEKFGEDPDFLFVALTNDNQAMEPYSNPAFLPAIGEKNWEKDQAKFGVLSYDMLENKHVIYRNSGYYAEATKNFLHLPANTNVTDKTPHIKTSNMSTWDSSLACELETFYDIFKSTCLLSKIEKLKGSYSIKGQDGQTLVKLFVKNDAIQIVFRNNNVPADLAKDKKRVMIGVGSSARSFIVVYKDITMITDTMKMAIVDFVEA